MYVMHTKLTLRLDDTLVERAKQEAARRGKSVSRMFADYIDSLRPDAKRARNLPPVTASLRGVLRGRRVSVADYRKHLREKYR
jgi:hypothetical protein